MHITYISGSSATAYDIICLIPLAIDEYLRIRSNGTASRGIRGILVPCLIVLSATCVVLNVIVSPYWIRDARIRPLNQLIRIIFLILHDKELFSQLRLMMRLIPRFLTFLTLLLFVGFFFSLFGMSVFPERTSEEGEIYFFSIGK